jgi:hypothetical protein
MIDKARANGKGAEYETGSRCDAMVDVETQQMVAEYRPFHYLKAVGDRRFFSSSQRRATHEQSGSRIRCNGGSDGPKKLISVPGNSRTREACTAMQAEAVLRSRVPTPAFADWFSAKQDLGLAPGIGEIRRPIQTSEKPVGEEPPPEGFLIACLAALVRVSRGDTTFSGLLDLQEI